MGAAQLELGNSAEAMAAFEAGRVADPELPDAALGAGQTLLLMGRWGDAVEPLRDALVQHAIALEGLRQNGRRARVPALCDHPMRLPLQQKVVMTEFIQDGARLGVDLSEVSDSLMQDSIEYHLFPNMFFFPGILIPMVYRFRPFEDSTDKCIFDLLMLEPLPEGTPFPHPPEPIRLDIEQ